MDWPRLGFELRIGLGLLFLLAGLLKVRGGSDEHTPILTVVGVPRMAARFAANLLSPTEVALALWLLSPWRTGLALSLLGTLLALFAVVIVRAIRMDYQGSCACFGTHTEGRLGVWNVIFDAFLLVAVLVSSSVQVLYGADERSVLQVNGPDAAVIVMLAAAVYGVTKMVREMESVARLISQGSSSQTGGASR